MKPDPWEHAEKDAVQAENLAATAWENGNVISYTYWMKRADEHRKVARKVRRQHDRAYRAEEEKHT